MNNLEKLIQAEREKANVKIAKLRRIAAAEQRRVDERVVALLRQHDSDLYERLATEATQSLADEKALRSRRAKTDAQEPGSGSIRPGSDEVRDDAREVQLWNG